MAYYLRWPDDAGNGTSNNQFLQITGITGAFTISWTVKEDLPAYTTPRYILDGRRLPNSTSSGGDSLYLLQYGSSPINLDAGISSAEINGSATAARNLFGAVTDDECQLTTSVSPSSGCVAFGARHNDKESCYGWAIADLSITDDNGVHNFTFPSTGGSGTQITSDSGLLTIELLGDWPLDDSQWVFYGGGSTFTADIAYSVTKPTFAATATSTAPAIFTADIDYSVSKPVFAASATSTVPGSGANVAFTVNKPIFAADAESTVPVFDGDISYTANKPTFAATATSDEPVNTGDVSYTANRPSFSASGTVVSPSGATISFVRQKPDFSVDATNVIPNYADVTFTRSKPTFAATGGIVAGDVSADIDFDVRKPIFSAVAKATGQTYNSKNIIRVRPRAGRVFARSKTNIIKVR